MMMRWGAKRRYSEQSPCQLKQRVEVVMAGWLAFLLWGHQCVVWGGVVR